MVCISAETAHYKTSSDIKGMNIFTHELPHYINNICSMPGWKKMSNFQLFPLEVVLGGKYNYKCWYDDLFNMPAVLYVHNNMLSFCHGFHFQALYERLFAWIVGRINDVIEVKDYNPALHGKNTVIGVLDIYGFEIFDNNRSASFMRCVVINPVKHAVSIIFDTRIFKASKLSASYIFLKNLLLTSD